MNIAIIDDHAMVRSSLAMTLGASLDEIDTVSEAASCEALLASGSEQVYDLILLDYHIPNKTVKHNFSFIKTNFPKARILFISSDENPQIILETIKYGASGFVVKSSDIELLIAAIKFVLAGGKYIPANIVGDIKVTAGESDQLITSADLSQLSKRQRDVFDLLLQQLSNKRIAQQLNISESTVKTHVIAIFKVLGIKSRSQVLDATL